MARVLDRQPAVAVLNFFPGVGSRLKILAAFAGAPIPSERSSAMVVCAPSPPVRLPSLCSLLIPDSNVWGMAAVPATP
jgi:hypothetical protein